MNPIEHWMMFSTFGEQRHFIYPTPDSYKGVIINGNMASYAPDGLAAFLLEKTSKQLYIIDPMTHAFQHDPSFVQDDEGNVKKSIHELARHLGDFFYSIAGQKPLLPRDFGDDKFEKEFVENCVNFQRTILVNSMKSAEAYKYFSPESDLSPYAYIAPYFFLTETGYANWLPIMKRCAKIARDCVGRNRLWASVVISKGILTNPDASARLCSEMSDFPVDGFLLWVDEFDEQSAGISVLKGFLKLCENLRKGSSRDVVNLHGGYFSILAAGNLGNQILTGVTHAPEFGEHRAVVPVGGGIPIARFYVPELHLRVRYREARSLFQRMGWLQSAEVFHANVCDCQECQATIAGDIANFVKYGEGNPKDMRRRHGLVRIDFPTKETKLRCLKHYLNRKCEEYLHATKEAAETLKGELSAAAQKLSPVIGEENVSHLRKWEIAF
jgi:hypothetical protein